MSKKKLHSLKDLVLNYRRLRQLQVPGGNCNTPATLQNQLTSTDAQSPCYSPSVNKHHHPPLTSTQSLLLNSSCSFASFNKVKIFILSFSTQILNRKEKQDLDEDIIILHKL